MYDVVERASEALQHDEKVTLDKLQGYADDTKDMTATKGRAAYFKEDLKVTLIRVHKVWFIYLML